MERDPQLFRQPDHVHRWRIPRRTTRPTFERRLRPERAKTDNLA
jgi:hypothetical protein